MTDYLIHDTLAMRKVRILLCLSFAQINASKLCKTYFWHRASHTHDYSYSNEVKIPQNATTYTA